MALVQQEMTHLVGASVGVSGGSAKRGGEPPSGLQIIKEALEAPEAALATPEYCKYKAEQEAVGLSPLCPLRWSLARALGPLDEVQQEPSSKQKCKAGASGERMEESVL